MAIRIYFAILNFTMLVIRGKECKENALEKEWSESNLNGCYIYNNLLCHNTKFVHSLLSIPYKNKFLTLVSGFIEEVYLDDNRYSLNSFKSDDITDKNKNLHNNESIDNNPFENFLGKFYIDYHPNFVYNIFGVKLLKSILLVKDANIVVFRYKLLDPEKSMKIFLSPLVSIKENDSISKSDMLKYNIAEEKDYLKLISSDDINIFFYFKGWEFNNNKKIIRNNIEKDQETYSSPGDFICELKPENNECYFAISSERVKQTDISSVFNEEVKSRAALLEKLNIKHELYRNIILSSSFYIRKENGNCFLKNSILNTNTSFQTMINSIYILFALREINDAKELLKYLADNIDKSIIPECFDKDKNEFTYDSIDNFFWYLLNVLKFIEITGEWKFVKDFLWEKIRVVLHNYYTNRVPGVKVDFDGLLTLDLDTNKKLNKGKIIEYAGGKHIALNSLWYNAIRIMELFSAKFADIEYHTRTQELSFIIKNHFYYKFWNKEGDYFSNRIDIPPDKKIDNSLCPYQIFTISLPYSDLIHYKTKRKIFDLIHDKLLTPYGLLTLSSDSRNYIPNFDPEKPGTAYNGIIHPYLLFHYITAFLKLNKYSKQAKKEAKSLLSKFEKKIKTNNIGFFPQFVDSQPSYNSAGSLDYSMTMSEYLRVRTEELGSI